MNSKQNGKNKPRVNCLVPSFTGILSSYSFDPLQLISTTSGGSGKGLFGLRNEKFTIPFSDSLAHFKTTIFFTVSAPVTRLCRSASD